MHAHILPAARSSSTPAATLQPLPQQATGLRRPPASRQATHLRRPPASPQATHLRRPPASPRAIRLRRPPESPQAIRLHRPPESPLAIRLHRPPESSQAIRLHRLIDLLSLRRPLISVYCVDLIRLLQVISIPLLQPIRPLFPIDDPKMRLHNIVIGSTPMSAPSRPAPRNTAADQPTTETIPISPFFTLCALPSLDRRPASPAIAWNQSRRFLCRPLGGGGMD